MQTDLIAGVDFNDCKRRIIMRNIIITAETGSDITAQEAKQYNIVLVPMHVSMGKESYDDGTFPPEEICHYYERTRHLPKTSGSTPEDFLRVFDRIHAEHPDAHILHLAYSAVTTVSYNSARIAAEDRDYVTLLDTRHVSAGQKAVILQVVDLLAHQPDLSMDDLKDQIEQICQRTRMCFVPSDLKYLHAGGRCGNLVYLGGTILKLHPCIEILDGKLVSTHKYRGSLGRVIPRLLKEYTEKNHLQKDRLWLIWSVGLSDELKQLAEKNAHELGFREIEWVQTGCVITTHGGPSAFGIVGISEE
jgi:DegV family protein with EDD domain